jgi:Carboxypeptidase regulatory-like domain/Effector-associated domain 9
MTKRSERLNRLAISSPCQQSWQAMSGAGSAESDNSARFCRRCNKHVHDLAALEAREVAALVEATRGRFCARITRDRAGRLVTRQPAPLPVAEASSPAESARRASVAAAAVVGAFVGLTGAAWAGAPGPIEPSAPSPWTALLAPAAAATPGAPPADVSPEPVKPSSDGAAGAVLSGKAVDEQESPLPGVTIVVRDADHQERKMATSANGSFVFSGLPAGVYTVEAELEGFEFISKSNLVLQPGGRHQTVFAGQAVIGEALTGVVITDGEPLRAVFLESRLVVSATVGPSVPLGEPGADAFLREVRTELEVTTVLKGTLRGGTVRVDRFEALGDEGNLQVGDTVLAFLAPAEAGSGRAADGAYVLVDSFAGLRRLPDEALRSYRQRIEALARLGEAPRPEELVEWLVATAENEHTRKEAVGELERAVEALDSLMERWTRRAQAPGLEALNARAGRLLALAGAPEEEVDAAVLGARLTPEHRERLSRALLATDRLTAADFDLYELVRPWAGDAASRWLARQLAGEPAPDGSARRAMRHLVEELKDEGLQELLNQADDEIEEAYEQVPGELDEADTVRLDKRIEAIEHELRRKFLRALSSRL